MSEQEMIATAAELRSQGHGFVTIGHMLGKSESWVRYRLVPGFREEQRSRMRNYGSTHRVVRLHNEGKPEPVPYDTRDLTGRICGDPLPGRSALDQKRLAEPLPLIEIAPPID